MSMTIKNPNELDIVEIEWIDSTAPGESGWFSMDDMIETGDEFVLSCFTSGYLVNETELAVWVVNSYHNNEEGSNCLGAIAIPKVAILKREILKKGQNTE